MKEHLGLCCHYLVNGKNLLKLRNFQLGRYNKGLYSEKTIREAYESNVNVLINNMESIFQKGYQVFRYPSGIFPLFDKVPEEYWNNDIISRKLKKLGQITKKYNVRASFHPGQFCSLSSDNPNVVNNSIREIEHHAWIFDQMELDRTTHYAINIHGGKGNRIDNLICGVNQLNDSARSRLTLENDEVSYSVEELFEVHKSTGTPIVWDSHHHLFRPGSMNIEDTMLMAYETWGKIRPLQHISNSKDKDGSFQKRRAHSDYITEIPDCQLKVLTNDLIDMDVEAKMKNIAIDKLIRDWKL